MYIRVSSVSVCLFRFGMCTLFDYSYRFRFVFVLSLGWSLFLLYCFRSTMYGARVCLHTRVCGFTCVYVHNEGGSGIFVFVYTILCTIFEC